MRTAFSLALGCLLLTTGRCAPPGVNDNSNDNDADPIFQDSPSGRAVAIVDPDGYEHLLDVSMTEATVTLRPLVTDYVRRFAQNFYSDADFVMFTIDAHRQRLRFSAVGGFNVTVRVPESGLGPFVSVPAFSNLPNLRSYIYLARKDAVALGPALHEIAHGWGVRYRLPPVIGQQTEQSENHWGFSSAGGHMGGWMPGTLMEVDHGRFALSAGHIEPAGRSFNTLPYAPLELYIMGLAGPDEVPPLEVAINPRLISLFEFTADRIETVTIEDIIAANGARTPDVADAQKEFAVVWLTLTDHVLDDEEWQFYEDSMTFFSLDGAMDINDAFPEERYAGTPIRNLLGEDDPEDSSRRFINFHAATAGRARLRFTIPAPRELPSGRSAASE